MKRLVLSESLSFEGNFPENLCIFFMEFDVYVDAAHPTATNATKIKIMLNLAGREAIERSRSFVFGGTRIHCKTGKPNSTT